MACSCVFHICYHSLNCTPIQFAEDTLCAFRNIIGVVNANRRETSSMKCRVLLEEKKMSWNAVYHSWTNPTHTLLTENHILSTAEVNKGPGLHSRYHNVPRTSRPLTWNKVSWVSWSILWMSSGTVQGLSISRSDSWSRSSVWTAVATCGGFCFGVLLTLCSASEVKTNQQ